MRGALPASQDTVGGVVGNKGWKQRGNLAMARIGISK